MCYYQSIHLFIEKLMVWKTIWNQMNGGHFDYDGNPLKWVEIKIFKQTIELVIPQYNNQEIIGLNTIWTNVEGFNYF